MSKKLSYEAVFFNLPEGWEDKASMLFEEGAHWIEVYTSLRLSKSEHEALFCNVEEYQEVFINGMRSAEAHWMKWARENVGDKNVNTNLYKLMMTRFHQWDKVVDKLELPDEDSANVKLEANKFQEKYFKTGEIKQ